jgi:hypothetical protein
MFIRNSNSAQYGGELRDTESLSSMILEKYFRAVLAWIG